MLEWFFSDPLPVGSPAPDFTLPDDQGNEVSLAALRGKNVVLVFYPRDETTVCTKQLCEFRDAWADVKAKNTVVFGVNPQDAESHEKFRANQNYPFPLLTDKGQKTGEAYRTKGFIVRRTVYLIGPDGVIRYAQRGKPEPSEVLAAAVV
ncbi:MAG TPA: peroxiredoxin [Bryobacteraceae bacterium]|nr:peroxiredoxin [Bryobacteraceae bacterium]